MNLVGCCVNILDDSVLETTHVSYVLKWLGIKCQTDVQPETAVTQLRCLSSGKENANDMSVRKLSTICHSVYEYLEDYCVMVKQRRIRPDKLQVIQDLTSHPVVLSSRRLIEPQRMAIELTVPLKPYLYEVDEDLYQLYPHFLKVVGVRERFGHSDILSVMTTITHDAEGGPLLEENLKCYCRAVQILVDVIGEEGSSVPEIQLPNVDGHLHLASKLCLNDCGWISDENHMLFLHPNISPKDGQALGVRTKRDASLAKHITAIPQAEGFGQHEPLTSRLKRIIDGYPKGVSILKELLQNADDAGATELMFIKDFRSHKTKKLFKDEWEELQGPALCVFNNSYFTEEHFIGIQSLGEGSKGRNRLKTGQYGVGFNVVYHLTDVPSFMTVGPDTEKTLCVLDPHQRYTPSTKDNTTGIRFKELHTVRETYKDVFPCYLEDSVMKTQQGTLFRFPLRTVSMAEKSKLSHHTTSISEIEEMLKDFKDEALLSILFLTSVNKITIASVPSDGELVIEHTVEATLQKDDLSKVQRYVSTLHTISENDLGYSPPYQIKIFKTLKDSRHERQDWLIVHQVEFDRTLPLPDTLKYSWNMGDIQLLPRGGVAVPLNQTKIKEGRLFCVLPLSKKTGLPIHINGHFVLGHEARRDLWQGTNDYRVHWNEHIIKDIICPSYLAAMKTLQTVNFPQDRTQSCFNEAITNYHKLFPHIAKTTDGYIKLLVKSFYTVLATKHMSLFPVLKLRTGTFLSHPRSGEMKVEWVPIVTDAGFPGYFNTFSQFLKDRRTLYDRVIDKENKNPETLAQEDRRKLTWILKDLGMKIIEPWTDVHEEFDKTDFKDEVKGTSPDVVISFLKSKHETNGCLIGRLPQSVSHTPLKSVSNVKRLTEFCQKDELFFEKMVSLPLMVTQSQILFFFREDKKYLVTKETNLLPWSADKLLHESLVKVYEKEDLSKTVCLRNLDITAMSQLLEENLDKSVFKTGQPTPWLLGDYLNDESGCKTPQPTPLLKIGKSTSSSEVPSRLWICHLWDFISTEVNKQVQKVRQKKREKTGERGEKEEPEDTEEGVTTALLNPLSEWSLIPTLWADQDGPQIYCSFLYPMKERKHVICLKVLNDEFGNILVKAHLPQLNLSAFTSMKHQVGPSEQFWSHIVADIGDPKCMLELLSRKSERDANLSVDECFTILSYFDRNVTDLRNGVPDLALRLQRLSFFPSLSGVPVCMNSFDQVHVVSDKEPYIPGAGLENLFVKLGHTLLIHKDRYNDIVKYLKVQQLSREDAYSTVIIPNMMELTYEDRMEHLLHIRDNMVQYNNVQKRTEELLNRLKDVPFIQTSDGQQHVTSDFYGMKVAKFKFICPANSFLPQPFDGKAWKKLLKRLGLKNQISMDDFVHFATDLERHSKRNITEEVTENSKLLVSHLQKRPKLIEEGLLKRINHIRFVLPYDIGTAEYGTDLKKIHSQFENTERLVCYSQSCDPEFYRNIWTSCSMWTKDADICSHLTQKDAEKACLQLEMNKEPSVDILVKHCQNICNSLKEKDLPFKKQRSSILGELFSSIYQLLQKYRKKSIVSISLKSCPTVYLDDQCMVVPAEDVIIDLSNSEQIPGYIFKAPILFGNFSPLFQALGAQKEVTANMYATLLQKLFTKKQGKKLIPNELSIVEEALSNLIICLKEDNAKADIQTSKLYLPNTDCILTDVTSLVYMDDEDFAIRMEALPLNYFLGFKPLKLPEYRISPFPQKYAMMLLSELVTETLSPSCLEMVIDSASGIAFRYEQKIRSCKFVKGILRICNHTCKEFSDDDASNIEEKLHLINIKQVEVLETVLFHKGIAVDGSEHLRDCFIMTGQSNDIEDLTNESVTVYFNSLSTKKSCVLFEIASAINTLTDDMLGRFTSVVEKMLAVEPESISEILDDHRVKKYTHNSRRSSTITVYPPAGTLIREEFHWMLDNSFSTFDKGEYVGLNVFDPFADDSQSQDGNSLPVYVYAIVIQVKDDTSPMAANYLVEVEEGMKKTVSATVLYKFYREKSNTPTDLIPSCGNLALDSSTSGNIDDILNDIQHQLQSAWDKLNLKERKLVRIRLLSQWHPDRNPCNVEQCEEVCKYIGLYIHQLEDEASLDVVDAHPATSDSSFYDEVTRRTDLHQTFRQSSGSSSYASCHQAARRQKYPYLGEAKRWFQQAKRDLVAARQAMSAFTPGNYNWICDMSHQAGEKALKAVLYTTDSAQADALKVHILPYIASDLDSRFQELAKELNDRARHHNRMRYPERSIFPKIPGDVYTRPEAEVTLELAEKIINIASHKVPQ